MTRENRIAWAAGFFDGEGCVSIIRRSAPTSPHGCRYGLVLQVAQIVDEPLKVFVDLWGGSINQRARGEWCWMANAGPALRALKDMLPFLVLKRQEAEVGIEFQEGIQVANGGRGSSISVEEFDRRAGLAALCSALKVRT